jgi:hypothetical protein
MTVYSGSLLGRLRYVISYLNGSSLLKNLLCDFLSQELSLLTDARGIAQRHILLPLRLRRGAQHFSTDSFLSPPTNSVAGVRTKEGSAANWMDLQTHGLYLDVAPWKYHVFEMKGAQSQFIIPSGGDHIHRHLSRLGI